MTEQTETSRRGRPRKASAEVAPKEPAILMRRRGRTVEAPKRDVPNMLANGWERVD